MYIFICGGWQAVYRMEFIKKKHQGINLSGLGNGKNVWTNKVYKLIECLLSCLKLSEIAKFDENYKN